MEFTVSDFEYVTLNDTTGREILMDEIYLLTNSKKLVEMLQDNIGEEYILFRTRSKYDSHKRLVLMHTAFQKSNIYWNIKNGMRYKCLGIDHVKGEAMLRQLNGNKRKLKYSKTIKDWAVI